MPTRHTHLEVADTVSSCFGSTLFHARATPLSLASSARSVGQRSNISTKTVARARPRRGPTRVRYRRGDRVARDRRSDNRERRAELGGDGVGGGRRGDRGTVARPIPLPRCWFGSRYKVRSLLSLSLSATPFSAKAVRSAPVNLVQDVPHTPSRHQHVVHVSFRSFPHGVVRAGRDGPRDQPGVLWKWPAAVDRHILRVGRPDIPPQSLSKT